MGLVENGFFFQRGSVGLLLPFEVQLRFSPGSVVRHRPRGWLHHHPRPRNLLALQLRPLLRSPRLIVIEHLLPIILLLLDLEIVDHLNPLLVVFKHQLLPDFLINRQDLFQSRRILINVLVLNEILRVQVLHIQLVSVRLFGLRLPLDFLLYLTLDDLPIQPKELLHLLVPHI